MVIKPHLIVTHDFIGLLDNKRPYFFIRHRPLVIHKINDHFLVRSNSHTSGAAVIVTPPVGMCICLSDNFSVSHIPIECCAHQKLCPMVLAGYNPKIAVSTGKRAFFIGILAFIGISKFFGLPELLSALCRLNTVIWIGQIHCYHVHIQRKIGNTQAFVIHSGTQITVDQDISLVIRTLNIDSLCNTD